MALEHFELGVTEVRLLFGLRSGEESEGPIDASKDNALHRACVVLLVSHFESFLKTLAEEYVDAIGDGQLESRRIPQSLRELHTTPRMSAIIECNSDVQRGVLLKKLQPLMALWSDEAKPPAGTLSSQVLSRQVTNADSETIDRLFAYMGSHTKVCDGDLDIANTDGEFAPWDIRYGLSDVTKCRNDIAHGDVSRKPTDGDVVRYIDFLSALARRLQRKADALLELVSP